MSKRAKSRKPATVRLDDQNAAACDSMSEDTGRSISWCVNVLLTAGRQYLRSGHPNAEELKRQLRVAALARQAAIQQQAAVRRFSEAVKQIETPQKIAREKKVNAA